MMSDNANALFTKLRILNAIDRPLDSLSVSDICSKAGISRQTLNNYVRSGKIERVGSGIYMLPDTIEDDMYAVSLHSKWGIFSHDTALFLNHLAERTPFMHSITIPSNASVPKSVKQQCNCHYIKPELYLLGATGQSNYFRTRGSLL